MGNIQISGHLGMAGNIGDQRECAKGNARGTNGQAVQPIGKVHGVGGTQQYKNGKGNKKHGQIGVEVFEKKGK